MKVTLAKEDVKCAHCPKTIKKGKEVCICNYLGSTGAHHVDHSCNHPYL